MPHATGAPSRALEHLYAKTGKTQFTFAFEVRPIAILGKWLYFESPLSERGGINLKKLNWYTATLAACWYGYASRLREYLCFQPKVRMIQTGGDFGLFRVSVIVARHRQAPRSRSTWVSGDGRIR